jgi:hypothetical protein
VLIFLIAGLLYLLRFERVDNLGAYSIPSETGLLIPSGFDNDGDNLISVRMQPDTRPVSQQVLSGLKISAILVALVIVCLVFPASSFRCTASRRYYWHVRYGNSVEVGRYRFPVPKQWYVVSNSTNDVLLVDLNTGDGIAVRPSSASDRFTLASWEALMSRSMADGSTKILGRKELQVGGERILALRRI